MSLSLPPFTRAVKWLIGINLAVYSLFLLLRASGLSGWADYLGTGLALFPALVITKGWIWQLLTYAFVHANFLHFLFNMIALWMFGSQMEQTWGMRRFLQLYFYSLLGAAAVTVGLSYTGIFGLSPYIPTVGASGGIYGILVAFGMTFPESEIYMLPFPISMKAKYFIWITVVITLISSLQERSGIAYVAHLGGLLSGFLFVKFIHQRRTSYATAGRYVGRGLSDRAWSPAQPPKQPGLIARVRDAYYRWKRRRATKKFEVYMRKHDRRVYFDEHGNYIPSDESEKENGESKGPWVN